MLRLSSLAVLAVSLISSACGSGNESMNFKVSPASRRTVVPTSYTCSTITYYLGRDFGDSSYLVDPVPGSPFNQTFAPVDAAGDSITLSSSDGIVFAWSSTALIRAILIRADEPGTALGDATNQLWLYAAPSGGGRYSGGGVYTEDNTNHRYPAKRIEFCFDAPPPPPEYQLEISKTAKMSYKTTYDWSLLKKADPAIASLKLSPGQLYQASFTVESAVSAATNSQFAAAGKIYIHNPAPIAANITSVTDAITDVGAMTVDCKVTFPYTLAAGGDLICDWSGDVPAGIDSADTATITTTGNVHGGQASANASFAAADRAYVDDCVTVSDDHAGVLGTFCAGEAPKTFVYSLWIGPYEACGDFTFTNTAKLVTDDTATTKEASVTIPISVPCDTGCTLTPGYWKTHSKYGPAPYDDTWARIGEDSAFYLSGKTWYHQFWTAPAGNAYWNLSFQYGAAVLNQLNGASMTAAAAAMTDAEWLLNHYTPAQIAGLRGSDSLRQRFISDAAVLSQFNAGEIGPGHCSE